KLKERGGKHFRKVGRERGYFVEFVMVCFEALKALCISLFLLHYIMDSFGMKLPPSMQPSNCIKVCIQDVIVRSPAEVLRLSLSKHKIRQFCARSKEHRSRLKHRFI
ncbi:hypothetical protein PV325_001498, partial [Microctonus aethiopoides]